MKQVNVYILILLLFVPGVIFGAGFILGLLFQSPNSFVADNLKTTKQTVPAVEEKDADALQDSLTSNQQNNQERPFPPLFQGKQKLDNETDSISPPKQQETEIKYHDGFLKHFRRAECCESCKKLAEYRIAWASGINQKTLSFREDWLQCSCTPEERESVEGANCAGRDFSTLNMRNDIVTPCTWSFVNFDNCIFRNAIIENYSFSHCSFRNADLRGFKYLEDHFFHCDLTNARLDGAIINYMDDDTLSTTSFYKNRFFYNFETIGSSATQLDFSGFVFYQSQFGSYTGSSSFNNAIFIESNIYIRKTAENNIYTYKNSDEQLMNTWNYKHGLKLGSIVDRFRVGEPLGERFINDTGGGYIVGKQVDLTNESPMVYVDCTINTIDVADMDDYVFINCNLSNSNITTEQLKSTWNYKNNRMDLIKLPPDLQKYFDEEKKTKE